jgi:hypothetical protein
MGVWPTEKQKNNRPKRHLPKSLRKWLSQGWLCLRESIATLFERKFLVVENNVEK